MELSVGANDIHLSLHPTYCAEDDGSVLQAVAKYKPFIDWLTRYQPAADYSLSRVVVRNVQWIAKRIAVLAVDAELSHAVVRGSEEGKGKLTQQVILTDEPQTAVLPVLVLNGHKYGVLIRQRRVALGGLLSEEAVSGTVTKEGFVGLGAEELRAAGFKLGAGDLTALRTAPFSLGDGQLPHSLVKTVHSLTIEEADGLLKGVPIADPNASGAVLIAQPFDAIIEHGTDLRAITAASLAYA